MYDAPDRIEISVISGSDFSFLFVSDRRPTSYTVVIMTGKHIMAADENDKMY